MQPAERADQPLTAFARLPYNIIGRFRPDGHSGLVTVDVATGEDGIECVARLTRCCDTLTIASCCRRLRPRPILRAIASALRVPSSCDPCAFASSRPAPFGCAACRCVALYPAHSCQHSPTPQHTTPRPRSWLRPTLCRLASYHVAPQAVAPQPVTHFACYRSTRAVFAVCV